MIKRSKILKSIIIMLIILATVCGVALAKTINGKDLTTYAGSYHDVFQNQGANLFGISWDSIKNNYYGAGSPPGNNDYQAYIYGSKDGYCLNDTTGNTGGYFYPAAIIDLEGGQVTVYSNQGTNTKYIGDLAAQFAKVVYYKYHSPDGRDMTSAKNKYSGQYWVNRYGWNNLYPQIESWINNSDIRPTYSTDSNCANYVSAKTYNISGLSGTADGTVTLENGSYNVGGTTYQTKIGKYNITYNSELSLNISIVVNGTTYSGIYSGGYIYCTSKITQTPTSIKVSQSYNSYKARLICLATGWMQSRMFAYAEETTISNEISLTIPVANTNVSLQKYIIKATNSSGLQVNYNDTASRANKGTTGTGNPVSNYKSQISKRNTSNNDSYKNTSPVQIEVGDKVTYRIYVYNNGDITAKSVTVEDTLPSNISLEDTTTTRGSYCTAIKRENNKIIATIENLPKDGSAYFDVTVKFNTFSANKIWNVAKITGTSPTNNTTYRTEDADSVKMKTYAVSLEKYISSVHSESQNISYTETDTNKYSEIKSYFVLHNISETDYANELAKLKSVSHSDINGDGKVDDDDLTLLNSYLEEGIITTLKSKYNAQILDTLRNYKSADINNDGKIDTEDVAILRLSEAGKYSEEVLNNIKEYIKYDLNKDGLVNEKDIEAYKAVKLDITGDKKINQEDLYTLLLMNLDLDGDNKVTNSDLLKLKSYKFKTSGNSKTDIENYLKYDLNGDGIIDESDLTLLSRVYNKFETYEQVEKTTEKNKEKEYETVKVEHEAYKEVADKLIENIGLKDYQELLSKIEAAINAYDINGDSRLDDIDNTKTGTDVYYINRWAAGEYAEYQNKSIEELKEQKLQNEINGSIDEKLNEYLIIDQSKLDINKDGKVDETDALVLQEIIKLLDINNNGMVEINMPLSLDQMYQGLIETVNDSDYNIAKILTFNETEEELKDIIEVYCADVDRYYKLYDINGDNLIDTNDITALDDDFEIGVDIYNKYNYNEKIDEFISFVENYIISNGEVDLSNTSNNYISSDLNYDNKVDFTDYDVFMEYGGLTVNLEGYLNTVSITTIDSKDLLNNIEITSTLNINTLDIDNNKVINELDENSLTHYLSYNVVIPSNITEEFINLIMYTDINGDGNFTETDLELLENYDTDKLDVNKDSSIDINDAKLLAEIINVKDINESEVLESIKKSNTTNYASREGKAEHNYDNNTSTVNKWKYNNVVTVSSGDFVTYVIKVKNDSTNTSVKITKITDTLPTGISMYRLGGYSENLQDYTTMPNSGKVEITKTEAIMLAPGESTTVTMTVKVSAPNISLEVFKNEATISNMKNYNNIEVSDTTPNNNTDADYFQLEDIEIAGLVWNDKAFDKNATNYNGQYDYKDNKESGLEGVTVYLYRVIKNSKTLVGTTTTNLAGEYTFNSDNIKAAKNTGNNRWNDSGEYYSYYIVFEYNGIKYTSTTFNDVTTDIGTELYKYDSNAKEDNGNVKENRATFNNRFSTINNSTGISYSTLNEEGYIPQSNHVYDSNKMSMQSSTSLISLQNNVAIEEQLKHINLGLKGRDTFDLELTSDIYSTKVSVNGQVGEYSYGNNVVTIRKSDIVAGSNTIQEDAANVAKETRESSISSVDQSVRMTDIENEVYGDTKLGIEVTYKLTIKNPSKTDGTATKVADYYDDRYTFVKAYDENRNILKTANGDSGNGFKSVVITTNGKKLTQKNNANVMEIYVVYKLNEPTETLKDLVNGVQEIPTFNIAEIVEYRTYCAENQTEYERGLIDVDSAPGSANKEQVRLTTTQGQNTATTNGNPTTVSYYFSGDDLTKLKYEDDTYATPTLYFVSSDNQRTITGKVFRDSTTTDATTKIKTGNGKIDDGEVGVYGAQVVLLEKVSNNWVTRYITTTNTDGSYTIKGFLPGEYMLQYYYGNKTESVLLRQSGNVNEYSYNGEDYQSTNNTGTHGAAKLNSTTNYWYLYNEAEGVSVAKDASGRRNTVSENVTGFIDEEMQVLNNIRDGKNAEEAKVSYTTAQGQKTITVNNIIEETWMNANSQNMIFNVEKSMLENSTVKPVAEFSSYDITNMNFGLSEVPVTTIDLQKHVAEFTITDSTGTNVIASMKYEDGRWKLKGDVILATDDIDVSIEDEKLQGARLEVTYKISANMTTEKNFDNKSLTVPTITGIVDYINNNFSYDENLGDNIKYWEVTTHQEIKDIYASQKWKDGTTPQGTADAEGKIYTTVVKAKADNPLLLTTEGEGSATITLEKVLTSTDSTIEDIITSTVDSFEYYNLIEITGLDYENVTPPDDPDTDPDPTDPSDPSDPSDPTDPTDPNEPGSDPDPDPQRDRIRTPDRYIIVPGVHHDTAISETIVIHPPTGDSSISIVYYVIAAVSLIILAAGAFGIRKFVLKK